MYFKTVTLLRENVVRSLSTRTGHLWYSIRKDYPVSLALLTIFHSLLVESSMMSGVIDKKLSRIKVETYSSIQTVNYVMMA